MSAETQTIAQAAANLAAAGHHSDWPSGLLDKIGDDIVGGLGGLIEFTEDLVNVTPKPALLVNLRVCVAIAGCVVVTAPFIMVVRYRQGKLSLWRRMRVRQTNYFAPATFNIYFVCVFFMALFFFTEGILTLISTSQMAKAAHRIANAVLCMKIAQFQWYFIAVLYCAIGTRLSLTEALAAKGREDFLPLFANPRVLTFAICTCWIPACTAAAVLIYFVTTRANAATDCLDQMNATIAQILATYADSSDSSASPIAATAGMMPQIIAALTQSDGAWQKSVQVKKWEAAYWVTWIVTVGCALLYLLPTMVIMLNVVYRQTAAQKGLAQALSNMLDSVKADSSTCGQSVADQPLEVESGTKHPSGDLEANCKSQAKLSQSVQAQLPPSSPLPHDGISDEPTLEEQERKAKEAKSKLAYFRRSLVFACMLYTTIIVTSFGLLFLGAFTIKHSLAARKNGAKEAIYINEIINFTTINLQTFFIGLSMVSLCFRFFDSESGDALRPKRRPICLASLTTERKASFVGRQRSSTSASWMSRRGVAVPPPLSLNQSTIALMPKLRHKDSDSGSSFAPMSAKSTESMMTPPMSAKTFESSPLSFTLMELAPDDVVVPATPLRSASLYYPPLVVEGPSDSPTRALAHLRGPLKTSSPLATPPLSETPTSRGFPFRDHRVLEEIDLGPDFNKPSPVLPPTDGANAAPSACPSSPLAGAYVMPRLARVNGGRSLSFSLVPRRRESNSATDDGDHGGSSCSTPTAPRPATEEAKSSTQGSAAPSLPVSPPISKTLHGSASAVPPRVRDLSSRGRSVSFSVLPKLRGCPPNGLGLEVEGAPQSKDSIPSAPTSTPTPTTLAST